MDIGDALDGLSPCALDLMDALHDAANYDKALSKMLDQGYDKEQITAAHRELINVGAIERG